MTQELIPTLTDNYGQIYTISGPVTSIGSGPQSTIVLDEEGVSESHAEILTEGASWILHDLTSGEKGVVVNDQKILAPQHLNDGDIISVGNIILRFKLPEKLSDTQPVSADVTIASTEDLTSFRSSGEIKSIPTSSATVEQAKPISKKQCRACHQLIHPEAEICPHCGVRQKSPPTAAVGKKSRTTAAILAILLGTFGAHKFYLGQPLIGLVYLFFFWSYIPGVIGIIEGVIYLSMSDEKFAEKYK